MKEIWKGMIIGASVGAAIGAVLDAATGATRRVRDVSSGLRAATAGWKE
jgi:hypothetical protein